MAKNTERDYETFRAQFGADDAMYIRCAIGVVRDALERMCERPTFAHACRVKTLAYLIPDSALESLDARTLVQLGVIARIESLGDVRRFARRFPGAVQ